MRTPRQPKRSRPQDRETGPYAVERDDAHRHPPVLAEMWIVPMHARKEQRGDDRRGPKAGLFPQVLQHVAAEGVLFCECADKKERGPHSKPRKVVAQWRQSDNATVSQRQFDAEYEELHERAECDP